MNARPDPKFSSIDVQERIVAKIDADGNGRGKRKVIEIFDRKIEANLASIWGRKRPEMGSLRLKPCLEDLRQEYVLVQAWKKTHDYVRAHNWYTDVLDLDLSNVRLRATIQNIQKELQTPQTIYPHDARLVLAPKSTAWEVGANGWRPKKGERQSLRPLAHVSIHDQTIATAFLMCVADIVETAQGNPEWDFIKCREKGMVSYGHRLMVDEADDRLSYRWGNAIYYRGYYQDYQNFIRRPDEIVKHLFGRSKDWAIVSADLSQFYDRVRPIWLFSKVENLCDGSATLEFLKAFKGLFLLEVAQSR